MLNVAYWNVSWHNRVRNFQCGVASEIEFEQLPVTWEDLGRRFS
jgi:hypothetical protein